MLKDSKALEISCYVVGAGAFGIFFRWMQLMLAYNDEELPDASAWNVLVPLLIAAGAFVFYRFLSRLKKERLCVPEDFFAALKNEGKLYTFCRWAIGFVMIAGSILLLATCELDINVVFLRILAAFGILAGISFPLLLSAANKPHVTGRGRITLCSLLPILFSAMWLLTCYKQNSINPVVWDYIIELLTLIVCLIAFFRMAGFAYGVVDSRKSMFFCMFGGMLCIMSIADSRYLGQQVMLGATALMLIMFNWIMVTNLETRAKEPQKDINAENGFEQV